MKKWLAVLFIVLFSGYVSGAKKYKLVEITPAEDLKNYS